MGKKSLKSKVKHMVIPILCATMALQLAACGKVEKTEPESGEGKEYVYVPEYLSLDKDGENTYYNNFSLSGDHLYYSECIYDEKTEKSIQKICKYSLQDGSKDKLSIIPEEDKSINNLVSDSDDNVILVSYVYNEDKGSEEGYSAPDIFLSKYDAAGTVMFEENITLVLNSAGEETYLQYVALDQQGNIYICSDRSIFLFGKDGSEQGKVELSNGWINAMTTGKDGQVYLCYYDFNSATGGMILSRIDFEGKKIGNTYNNIPNVNGNGFSAGVDKDVMMSSGNKVYEYDLETQTYDELFSWLDCDINGDYVTNIGALEDGTIIAVIQDWDTGAVEIAKLFKKEASQITEKETVTIGCLYMDQELQAAAVAFNKSNDKYRVTIKNYMDENSMDANAYETAITNLQNSIVSGTDCPDLLDLSQIETQSLISKGAFEDLFPYLEKSSVLHKEDFMENILEGNTYDGKLISLPARFTIETIMGKTSLVGEEMGWTLEELMAFAKKHPDAALFSGEQRNSALYSCLLYNQSMFIDWNKGDCHFDSDEFKEVLEFVQMFPEEVDWSSYDEGAELEQLQNGGILLQKTYIYDLQEMQVYEAKFGEPVTYIGYPTADGSIGCSLSPGSRYGITFQSQHKDGAWAFIEYYLTTDARDRYAWGFPALKDKFDKMVEDAVAPEYLLDENGEAIGTEGVASMTTSSGWTYTYHTPTREEADTLRELVSVAKVAETPDTEVMNIILEEADAYFKGQKSIDDVADIIQSRVKIYISENS